MRRTDREITNPQEIARIMARCKVVSIAFGGDTPYVIAMNFGFSREEDHFCLYLHGAGEGEKMRRVRSDPRAAFSMYTDETLLTAEMACGHTMDFESVCGSGKIEVLAGEDKRYGLSCLMAQLVPGREWTFDERMLRAVTVLRLDVEHISGKRHQTAR